MLAQAPMRFFNAENARLYAMRSVEARRQRKLNPPPPPPVPVAPKVEADDYQATRLTCVRRQLASLDKSLNALLKRLEEGDDDVDAAQIDRLASAQARLAEQERQLAGRPLPGSLKPRQAPIRRPASDSPVIEEPSQPCLTPTVEPSE